MSSVRPAYVSDARADQEVLRPILRSYRLAQRWSKGNLGEREGLPDVRHRHAEEGQRVRVSGGLLLLHLRGDLPPLISNRPTNRSATGSPPLELIVVATDDAAGIALALLQPCIWDTFGHARTR